MGRRLGNPGTITVVVPRQGTPTASKALVKAVTSEVKKTGRVFQAQEPLSGTELQGLDDASTWNGLLLNARGERGPQWDVTSQMHHVDFGSPEYFNPNLLLDEPEIPAMDTQEMKPDDEQSEEQINSSQDVDMGMEPNPAQGYPPPGVLVGDPQMRGPPGSNPYPPYGQPMNGMPPQVNAPPMGDPMAGNPMYSQGPPQHPMHPLSRPELAGMPPQQMYGRAPEMMRQPGHHAMPIGGLSYNNTAAPPAPGHPHGMDPATMGMSAYNPAQPAGYGPGIPPGHAPQYARGPPGSAPMSGSYGGMY
ncbi:hypothetical protein CPB86DRAFT_803815 [Serendipita vermifera]|nr:hypothetical protein CPB86DRAFT_803815 [Serendipita vermifera]